MYPVLFQSESVTIYSYSFMMSLAFLAGSLLFIFTNRGKGIETITLFKLLLIAQFSALAGARLLFVINNPVQFQNNILMAFAPVPGGFALNGGLVFGVIAALLYMHYKNIAFYKIADNIVLPLAMLIIFLKTGCLLGGCCFGNETDFLGIHYPDSSPAFKLFGAGHHLHAVPFYEAGSVLLIMVLLGTFHKKNSFHGESLLLFTILYCLARIITDFFRGDVDHYYLGAFSQTQVISIIALISLSFFYMFKLKQLSSKAEMPA